ncbi:glycosyltransferase family 2 protein [Bradyrhizobium monzae]|uniref:glycosyltransferase family 2 protein n=1 Tax=Bradyrhizobium sp. Oc8 TaxID=2876780 RepID=UPI001F3C4B81|nr:glycosyltransferase family 2 protein [Bradyrhizobium sp. Oc8]
MSCPSKLQAIIVNFRTPKLTIRCIRSMLEHRVVDRESVLIVDNCSGDNSVEEFRKALPDIRTIVADHNGGFGAGVNLGVAKTTADYLLILNPDTYFEFNSAASVVDLMERGPGVALVGMDLVNPDGSRQYSARRFYSVFDVLARRVDWIGAMVPQRAEKHLMKGAWETGEPFDAEWVMGTGFVVRRSAFELIRGMDERYFLYMEDVDLCARLWRAGYKVKGMPGAKLVHDHQRSSAAGPLTFAGRTHIHSLFLFRSRFTVPLFRPPGVDKIARRKAGN